MTGNVKIAIGVGGVLLLLWSMSRADTGTTCKAPAFLMKPGDPLYIAALDHSPNKTGYCAVQGNVTDAGTQPMASPGPVDSIGAAIGGAVDKFTSWLGGLGAPASSTPTDRPITSPDQVANGGPVNSAQFDPLSEAS